MLDQSFSAKNFETIFTLLNRQGKVEIDAMSVDYRAIVGEIHAVNEEIKLLCRKKKALRTEDKVSRLSELQESLSSLRYKKSETLIAHMEALADEVNSRLFAFNISTSVFDGKEEFMLDDSLAASYASTTEKGVFHRDPFPLLLCHHRRGIPSRHVSGKCRNATFARPYQEHGLQV